MRVVLLNDRRVERESIVRALQVASCTVEAVGDAKAALAAIAREPPQVVVMSIPPTGAADLVRLLRGGDGSGRAYLVALLEGTPGGRDIAPILAAGAHDFVRRPLVEAELVARVKAPMRLLQWAQAATKPGVFDFSKVVDVSRLNVWKDLAELVAEDLGQMFGRTLQVTAGWPARFGRDLRGATISMSLAADEVEVRVSILADLPTQKWLGNELLGDPNPSDVSVHDVLRELANTAGGAVKRAALPENVTLTTGIPINEDVVHHQGERIQAWTVTFDGGKTCFAIVAEIRSRENQRVPASSLREGMVLVHDLRSESGALLVTAGSRLTTTTATRLAQMLGPRFLIDVACAA